MSFGGKPAFIIKKAHPEHALPACCKENRRVAGAYGAAAFAPAMTDTRVMKKRQAEMHPFES
jgi:hypothetical protein